MLVSVLSNLLRMLAFSSPVQILNLNTFRIFDVLIILIGIVLFLHLVNDSSKPSQSGSMLYLFILGGSLTFIVFSQLNRSDYYSISAQGAFEIAFSIFFLFGVAPLVIGESIHITSIKLKQLIFWYSLGTVSSVGFAVVAALGNFSFEYLSFIGYESRRQPGLSTHPIAFGLNCLMTIPLIVMYFKKMPLKLVFLVNISLLGCFLSGSRTIQVGAIFITVISFLSQPKSKELKELGTTSRNFLTVSLSAIGFLEFIRRLLPREEWQNFIRFKTSYAIETGNFRGDIWRLALSQLNEHPFVGITLTGVKGYLNIYLQVLIAGGILLFIIFFGRILPLMLRKHTLESFENIELVRALKISILSWLIAGFTSNSLFDRNIILVLSILIFIHEKTYVKFKKSRLRPATNF